MKNPLRRIRYNSPVVLTFALASLAVLLLDYATSGWTTLHFFCVYAFPLTDPLGYFRLLGHVLGHAGLEHYVSNMTLLLVLGPMLEEKYGSKNLLCAFAFTALVSGLIHCAISPGTALLGASGIVFMCIMLASLAGMENGTIPLTLILVAALYIGGEIVTGLTQQDSISQITHIVGGICGTGIGFFLAKEKKATGKKR